MHPCGRVGRGPKPDTVRRDVGGLSPRGSVGGLSRLGTACHAEGPGDWTGWIRGPSEKELAEAAATVLSSDVRLGPVLPGDAAVTIEEARVAYVAQSARIEFCKSRGVDYERAVRYLPLLEELERALPPSRESKSGLELVTPPRRRRSTASVRGQDQSQTTLNLGEPYIEVTAMHPYPSASPSASPSPSPSASGRPGSEEDEVPNAPPPSPARPTSHILQHALRVRIMGMSEDMFRRIVEEGRCPLCGNAEHSLPMCPLLPNELRPFCE